MKRWIERWNAYWFPQASTLYLAISRIIVVAAQLFWVFPSLEKHLNLLLKNSHFIDPQLFIRLITAVFPRETFFTPSVFVALYWITAAAGLAALVGLFTRGSMFVFALGIWFFVTHEYSYGDRHHTEAIYSIFLMCLAFSPSGDRLSIDALLRKRRGVSGLGMSELTMWPLKFAHVLLSMTYFSTGASKLVSGGLSWMNGYTLQRYTFGDAINRGFPLGIWLGQQHTLAIILSIFTVMFELCFFVSLFLPRWAPLFFASAIMFHVGLFFAAGHDFFQHIVLNFALLICLFPSWWESRLGRSADASGSGQPARASQPA